MIILLIPERLYIHVYIILSLILIYLLSIFEMIDPIMHHELYPRRCNQIELLAGVLVSSPPVEKLRRQDRRMRAQQLHSHTHRSCTEEIN